MGVSSNFRSNESKQILETLNLSHRNLLLPVNFLSWDDGEESVRSDSTYSWDCVIDLFPGSKMDTFSIVNKDD